MVPDTVRAVLAFCDEDTLRRATQVSAEWADAAQDDQYWQRLCQVRHNVVAKPVTVERWVDWFATIEEKMQKDEGATTPLASREGWPPRERAGSVGNLRAACLSTPKILKGRRDHAEPEEERDGIAILESGEVMIEEDRATFVDASFEEDYVIRRLSSSPTATAVLSPYRVPVATHRDHARASSEPNLTGAHTPHRPTFADHPAGVGLFRTPTPPAVPPPAYPAADDAAAAPNARAAATPPTAHLVHPPAYAQVGSTPPHGRPSDNDLMKDAESPQDAAPRAEHEEQVQVQEQGWEIMEEAPEEEPMEEADADAAAEGGGDVEMQDQDQEQEAAAPQPSTSASIHTLLASLGAPVAVEQDHAGSQHHAAAPPQLEPPRAYAPPQPSHDDPPPQPIRGGSPGAARGAASLGRLLQPPSLQPPPVEAAPAPTLQHAPVGQRWQPPTHAATPPAPEPAAALSPQLSFDDNESLAKYLHASIRDTLAGGRHPIPERFGRMVLQVVDEAASLRAMFAHQKQVTAETAEELLDQQAKNTQLMTKNIAVSSRLEESKRCVRKLKKGISDTKNTTLPLHNELVKVRRQEEQAMKEELEDLKVQAGKFMAQRDQVYEQLQGATSNVTALQDLVADLKEQHEVDLQAALASNCTVQADAPLEAQNASLRINLEGMQTMVKQSYAANQELKQRLEKEEERQQQMQEMQLMYQRLLDERQHERSQWSQYEEKYLLQIQTLHRALQQQQALNRTLNNVAQVP